MQKLTSKEIENLSNTTRDFFLLYTGFWQLSKSKRYFKYLDG